jgi:4-amino-4-deoxy-L-arabinose transferase-like glycosyltransferase
MKSPDELLPGKSVLAGVTTRYYRHLFTAILALACFNLFVYLGRLPVNDWDEARHGISAYEMLKSGNLIINTYMGNPDYWNLKPPLGFWMIAAAYKLFGFSIFSMRFFSALLTLMSVGLTMAISKKHFGELPSLLTGGILSTCYGFILEHSGRTGDIDAALAFFTVLMIFFLDRSELSPAYLYCAGFSASLAFLAKSFASLPVVAAAILYLIARRRLLKISSRQYITCAVLYLLPVAVWACARYFQDGSTFLKAMLEYDLLRRTGSELESHGGPSFYYAGLLMLKTFTPWSYLMLAAAAFSVLVYYRDKRARAQKLSDAGSPIFLLMAIIPFLLFSLAQTKLPWYINMIYPALAILSGQFFFSLINKGPGESSAPVISAACILIFLTVFTMSEWAIIKEIGRWKHSADDSQMLLSQLPKSACKPGDIIHIEFAGQSLIFMGKVIKGLEFSSISRDIFATLKNSHRDDLLYLEFMTRSVVMPRSKAVMDRAKPGDLMLLRTSPETQHEILTNNIPVVVQNNTWLIARKP